MRKWMTAGMCFLLVMMTISGFTDTLQENTKRDSSDSISVQDNLSDETVSGESNTERDFEDGNFTFYSGQGYGHDYPYTYEYIYNGLRMFEPIMRGGTT